MPTLAEMLRQGSWENPNNPYSASLLSDALRGSLSNAESLSRGAAVAPVGIFGDINALAREYVTPKLPSKVQAALESMPAAPTTEQILSNIPRASNVRRETLGMEQLGVAMNPSGPVELAKGAAKGLGVYGRMAGNAVNDAMVYGRGPFAGITPQPMRMAEDFGYRGTHKAPSPEYGAPLYDLTGGGQMYPANVYSSKAAQYYGTGYPKADKEAFSLANKVRGNPDAEVTMYRAVPKDEKITNINAGDWVTLSKDYAKNHGESVLGNDYKILSQKVKAKDLWTNADSIHEFGYQPQTTQKPSFTYPQEEAMRLAQQRAALPKEQFGLGLSPDNTAQQRADAMFPFDVYHGTNADIQAMNTAGKGKTSGAGAFVNDNPLAAETYVNASGGGNIIPMRMSKEGLLDVNAKGRNWADIETNTLAPKAGKKRYSLDEMELSRNDVTSTDELGTIANDLLGLKGVNIKNVKDLGPNSHIFRAKEYLQDKYGITPDETWSNVTGSQFGEARDYMDKLYKSQKSTVTAVQDPDLLRSRFAAFDPWRRTAATAAAMGVAAPDLLAKERK